MKTYKAIQGEIYYLKNFADIQAAKAYFDSVLTGEYQLSEAPQNQQIQPQTDAQKLSERQEFGKQLVNQYLIENDAIAKSWGRPFTVAEAAQQAQKLQLVMALLPNGSLKQVVDILGTTAADTILTQDRIDSYISQLNAFIAAQ